MSYCENSVCCPSLLSCFSLVDLLPTFFPSPTPPLVWGTWADPFVPTAILGETLLYLLLFFWQRKCIFTYSLRWLSQDATNQAKIFTFPICFCFLFFFLALLITMASSPSYLLEAPRLSPVFPTPPSPLPSPFQMKGLFWAEAASLHLILIHINCLACHATDLFVLSFCMDRCGLDGGGVFFFF